MTRFELIDNAYTIFKNNLTTKQLEYVNENTYTTFVAFIESYLNGYSFHLNQYEEFSGQLLDSEVIEDFAYALAEWMQYNCGFITSKAQCQNTIKYIKENKGDLLC